MTTSVLKTPIGSIKLITDSSSRLVVEFPDNESQENHHSAHQQLIDDIQAYFSNPKHTFAPVISMQGSTFQQKVWRALCQIPVGTVKTYGELAKELKTSARAIGQACKKNPCPIIVPCHRVVGAKSIGGYAGDSHGRLAKIKQWLLEHEAKSI